MIFVVLGFVRVGRQSRGMSDVPGVEPSAAEVLQRVWAAFDGPAMACSNESVLDALCVVVCERRDDLAVRGLLDMVIQRAYSYDRDRRR